MIRNLALLFALLAVIGVYTFYDDYSRAVPSQDINSVDSTHDAQSAPDFTFETMAGKTHRLSDFEGKTIVLNFWASWCAPCVVEFPQMVKLAGDTKDKTVFIFLSLDDTDEAVKRFVAKYVHNATDNVLIGRDADKSVSEKLYQTYKLPETYIISPDLRIKEKIIGADVDWTAKEMRRTLQ